MKESEMKHLKTILALSAGLLFTATACVNETEINELYRPAGTPIVFSAASGYDNGVETKAEYSGHFYNSKSYERIDWFPGDKVRIVYNSEAAHYTVNGTPTADNEISNASLAAATTSDKLVWEESNDHEFYALYPSDGTSAAAGSLTTAGVVSGRIPRVQAVDSNKMITDDDNVHKYQPNTAEYGYMAAYQYIDASSTATSVVLPFRPAVTTFEFKFSRNSVDTYPSNIRRFTLSTETVGSSSTATPLNGDFSFSITGMYHHSGKDRGAEWDPSLVNTTAVSGVDPNSIVVDFGTSGVAIPATGYLDFSILALPVDITGAKMTIEYVSGATKSLALKTNQSDPNSWYTFTGAKKYVITNDVPGDEVWHFVVEEIDDIVTYGHQTVTGLGYNVKSYKWNDREGNSVKYPVKWKTQYTTDGGTTWTDLPAGGYVKDAHTTFSVNTLTGNGVNSSSYSTGEDRSASIVGTSGATISGDPSAGAAIRALLATRSVRGSEVGVGSGPFDLSKHPTYGSIDTEGSQNTANSYVVFAPGVYMFPCVYGNALKNGRDNKSAYWPSAADDPNYDAVTGAPNTLSDINTTYNTDNYVQHYYTPRFYNALNRPITTPYIKNDLNASGLNAIVLWQDTYVGDEIIPYTSGYVGMTTVSGVDYIWFKVDKEHIQPGNFVVALKGSAGSLSDEILWSWHIWVTEKDLTPSDEVVNNAGTYHLMPYNLGWVDTVDGSVEKWEDREIEYRIVQTDNNGNELPIADPTGDDETFTVTQIGDAITVQTSIGANPYYQWGRKDPQIPAVPLNYDGTQYDCTSRQVSPNPDYNIPTNGALVPAQAVSTRVMDYATGIKLPYIPLSNIEANNGRTATGWVGGPVYPYRVAAGAHLLTKEDRGPFLFGQAVQCNNAGLTNANAWRTEPGTGTLAGNDLYYIKDDFPYNFGPYTTAQKDILVGIDPNAHFSNSDFVSGDCAYPASFRSKSGTPYNLWNSYIYAEKSHENDVNKFKTIYDPCPPGFTVPSRQVFIGTNSASVNADERTKSATPTWTPTSRETASVMLNGNSTTKTIGVNFNAGGTNTIFLPFTGSRVFYHNNGNPNLQAEWAGGMGFYWTDNPYGINFLPGESNQYTIASFWWFHSSYSFSFAYPSFTSQTYTKGSAFSIRPMVDPKY